MLINLTDNPSQVDEKFIIDSLWAHNHTAEKVDIRPLFVTLNDYSGRIIGGLVVRTWWGGLEIQYLWIGNDYRTQGYGRQLMLQAEKEAQKRGCHIACIDTFSFQAKDFYQKLGYREYGHLGNYACKHTRYYLTKNLYPLAE